LASSSLSPPRRCSSSTTPISRARASSRALSSTVSVEVGPSCRPSQVE
jgi:hypothetical protein